MSEPTYERWYTDTAWQVNYSLPKNEAKGRRWNENHAATVVCATAQRAIVIVLECEPDANIHNVNRGGRGVVMVDKRATASEAVTEKP